MKLEFAYITTEQAIGLFEDLQKRPTEKAIRDTA